MNYMKIRNNSFKRINKKITDNKMILIASLLIIDIYFYYLNNFKIFPFVFFQEYKLNKEIYKFKSFSEYYEDLILYLLLYNIKNGFYIDVGAFDPNSVSVTKAFYIRGWNGINIEPQENKIKLFEKERPNDINLQTVVGNNEGNVTLYINDQCSTIKKEFSKGANESINIKMDTMSNVCKKYVPKEKEIDFCKIDVEGNERDVLLGYDFDNYKPKVFCIESTIPMSFIPNHQLWEEILINNSYTFIYKEGVNRFYANNNFSLLFKRSKYINEYVKKVNRTKFGK